jgi:hypothetical protein
MTTKGELANFIIDLEDEECPNSGLHLASYQGDIGQLREFLKDSEYLKNIDATIRPFLATPLRLAATGQQILLKKCGKNNLVLTFELFLLTNRFSNN